MWKKYLTIDFLSKDTFRSFLNKHMCANVYNLQ
jgi:hypothetical protein